MHQTFVRFELKMQTGKIERFFTAASTSFLLGMLMLLMASCDGPAQNAPDTEIKIGNTLRYDVNAQLGTLEPLGDITGGATHIFPLLYSYLFVPDAEGNLKSDLATEWRYNRDDLTWTFRLNPDARFHNGEVVTSADVKYSLGQFFTKYPRDLSDTIDRIEPVSDTVIRIRLKKHTPDLPIKIWDYEVFPKPGKEKMDWINGPIGSGPFRFHARKGHKEVTLEANPSYHGGRPAIDRVVFYYGPEKETSWTRLLRGETDIIREIVPWNYEIMGNIADKFHFDRYPLRAYSILLYNTKASLFADDRVRWALTHAIDREYMVTHILGGFGEVANGSMGVGSPFHNPEVVPLPYDPEKSLALFHEAGWSRNTPDGLLTRNGRSFEFTIDHVAGNMLERRVANYIKLNLAEVGIKTHLNPVTHEVLMKMLHQGDAYQAVLIELQGVYRMPEKIGGIWVNAPEKETGGQAFNHPEVSVLGEKVLSQSDPEQQKVLLHRLDALICDLQPGSFLFHKTAIDVMSRRITPIQPFSLTYEGIYRLQYATIQ